MTFHRPPGWVARDAMAMLRATGGATVSAVYGVTPPTAGYVVALPGNADDTPAPPTGAETFEQYVARYARQHRSILAVAAHFLGLWWKGQRLHLDVVEVYCEEAVALDVAARRGERAVWDLAERCEIEVAAHEEARPPTATAV